MAKRNGGIIGPANTPTASVAAGVWRLRDAFNSIKNGTWPLVRSVATNSLRFNSGSSDYLNRTFGTATNRKIFTFSLWVKRSTLSVDNGYLIAAGTDASTNVDEFYFRSGNTLDFSGYESSVTQFQLRTTPLYRDVSAWYHVVVAYDSTQATSSNRIKMYVNGSQVTDFAVSTYPSQNFEPLFNSATAHTIARNLASGSRYQDGYFSEYHFVDGQALTPSSFGASNSSGVWYPIPYQGTWGNNGFYLKFANSASLGTDSSGNNNTWTVNNLTSVDQSTDTELNNFCTWNAVAAPYSAPTLSEGNLKVTNNAANWQGAIGTFGVSQGKWYWEARFDTTTYTYNHGVIDESVNFSDINPMNQNGYTGFYNYDGGEIRYNGTVTTADYGTFSTNDIIGIALNMDAKQISFYKNGTILVSNFGLSTTGQTLVFPSTTYYSGGYCSYNFGNPPYSANGYTDAAGYGNFSYAVPSGYYALCTANLNTYG